MYKYKQNKCTITDLNKTNSYYIITKKIIYFEFMYSPHNVKCFGHHWALHVWTAEGWFAKHNGLVQLGNNETLDCGSMIVLHYY